MIGLVLVTHGRLAIEFVTAMEHVVGPQDAIASICIGPEDDMEARRGDIATAISSVDRERGVIILTDLFGGTPSNLAISLMGGTITSTFLTLLVVPLLYYKMMRNKEKEQ